MAIKKIKIDSWILIKETTINFLSFVYNLLLPLIHDFYKLIVPVVYDIFDYN